VEIVVKPEAAIDEATPLFEEPEELAPPAPTIILYVAARKISPVSADAPPPDVEP
jgi:hypothetical protein